MRHERDLCPSAYRLTMPVQPLPALVGNLYVPVWAVRPCSYQALRSCAAEMPLWLLIHSRTGDYWQPCYASREQLGKTIGYSVRTITRQLSALRDVALLFEVDRGVEPKTRRRRPPARWACDPMTADRWHPKIVEAISSIAEEDGHSTYWTRRSLDEFELFSAGSGALRVAIAEDMPFVPRPPRKNSRKRKRSKRI